MLRVPNKSLCAALLAVIAGTSSGGGGAAAADKPERQPVVSGRVKPVLTQGRLRFRDADGDGKLSPYEDWRLPASARVKDLLSRMTPEEKIGTLVHATLPAQGGQLGRGDGYDLGLLSDMVQGKRITSYITRMATRPEHVAEQNNQAQEVAERGRLGIPLTISTDPRNHFQFVLGAAENAARTTRWPEELGFAALGDATLVRRFGDIARKE